jgi:hypothetical protein
MTEARISLSGYQYVQNRPMNLVDPTGMLDAKSMYGGTYGYDSQQAAQKSVSDRMDDAEDKQFNSIGARTVQDFEGNSHTVTADDIQGAYDVAGVWKTTATAGGYSTTTYDVVLQKSGTKSCCAGAIAFFATGETIAAESSVIPPAAVVIAVGVAIGAGLYATYEYFHPAGSKPIILEGKDSKKSGKERATDVPDWSKEYKPKEGETAEQFANRVMNEQYGEGNWAKGSIVKSKKITIVNK